MNISGYENYVIFEDGVIINAVTGKKKKIVRDIKRRNGKKTNYITLRVDLSKNGYSKRYTVSRLMMKHFKPNEYKEELYADHINRDSTDNRIENLRMLTHTENCHNTTAQIDSLTGIKNISFQNFRNQKKKWRYKIQIKGESHMKFFSTLKEALEYKIYFEQNNEFLKKINIV
jgi:hypothetical protein